MIAGIHYVRKRRKGRASIWYVYAYRGGPCVHQSEGERRPTLNAAALRKVTEALEAGRREDVSTLRSLIRRWRSSSPDRPSSPEWEKLASTTKKTWGSALDAIDNKFGDTPLRVWNDPRMVSRVVAWRDSRAATPRAADIGVTVLRALLEFGRLRSAVTFNAADKIPKLYREGGRAEIIWTDTDIDVFIRNADEMNMPLIADGLRLAALTGLRRDDLVTLTWSQVTDVAISKKARKQSAGKRLFASMPRIPALDALLRDLRKRERQEGVNTVLVNSHGRPWTGGGFGGQFNRVRDAAGIAHEDDETGSRLAKHLHDVRGTFATKLMTESDLTDHEIADIMGWAPDKVTRIRRVYVDQSRIIVALGERIKRTSVNRAVNR